MAHEHSVIDTDTHFSIDPKTLVVSCSDTVKTLRRKDHAAERFTFIMPRYIEGHDMSLCNAVEAHYDNIHYDSKTRTTTENKSFDEVEGFGITADDEESISFSWLVKGDATELDGTLNFCIRFACEDEMGNISYQRFTEIYEGVPVGKSIHNTEAAAKAYVDILERWRAEMMVAIENAGKVKTVNGVEPDESGNIEIKIEIPEVPEQVQANLSEADETNKAYVGGELQGRHIPEGVPCNIVKKDIIFPEAVVSGSSPKSIVFVDKYAESKDLGQVTVVFNGVEYHFDSLYTGVKTGSKTYSGYGNFTLVYYSEVATNEPFCLCYYNRSTVPSWKLYTAESEPTVEIYTAEKTIHPVDVEIIPDSIARMSDLPTWETLSGRPFGEEVISFEWSGNYADLGTVYPYYFSEKRDDGEGSNEFHLLLEGIFTKEQIESIKYYSTVAETLDQECVVESNTLGDEYITIQHPATYDNGYPALLKVLYEYDEANSAPAGIYIGSGYHYVCSNNDFRGEFMGIKKIEEEYIPDTIARTSDIPATPEDIGADPAGTAETAVSNHNTATDAHSDIRQLINALPTETRVSEIVNEALGVIENGTY